MIRVFLLVLVSAALVSCLPPAGFPDLVDSGYPKQITLNWLGVPQPVDAVFQRSNGKIYFFVGTQYYRLSDKNIDVFNVTQDKVDEGYPQSISAKWGFPGPIQAIFQRKNGKIYAFGGTQYWRVSDKYLDDRIPDSAPDAPDAGYPKVISQNFLGLPSTIDAAFYRLTGQMYFFKGSQYWVARDKYFFADIPETSADYVEGCYPRSIAADFRGLPSGITVQGAFQRSGSNNHIYLFSGANYYKFQDKFLQDSFADIADADYPQQIAAKWPQCSGNSAIPTNVDAAFQRLSNGKMYFFKGSQYWRVTDKNVVDADNDCVDAGYPKTIAGNWVGVPDNIDGAFSRPNGYIYFFKGSQYYRVEDKYYSPTFSPANPRPDAVDAGYPQSISTKWLGVPDNIDGVFERSSFHIYFFKGSQYYRLKDKNFYNLDDDVVETGYPKSTADNWLGVSTVDAVFQRSVTNGKIYFFSGSQYTRVSDKLITVEPPCTLPSQTIGTYEAQAASLNAQIVTLRKQVADLQAAQPSCPPTPSPTPAPANGNGPSGANVININFAGLLKQ